LELPARVIVESITEPSVLKYTNTYHQNAVPHWHIVIPVGEGYFVVTFITKQKDKRISYYSRGHHAEAIGSLVDVGPKDFDFLITDSIIECNQTNLYDKDEFVASINSSHPVRIEEGEIPDRIIKDVYRAIKDSPVVDDDIKARLP